MFAGQNPVRAILTGAVALAIATSLPITGQAAPQQRAAPPAVVSGTSEVKVLVNNEVITSGDIAKRINFMRLQHQTGDLPKLAKEQLVTELLKRQEIQRVRMSVSTTDVDASYARFAASNKMKTEQLNEVLAKTGVTPAHFKAYIAIQMSWPRVLNARFGASGKLSPDELITRMTQNKNNTSTTEYFLKQVIFVVPAAKKGTLEAKRKAEADASRAKFPGCEQAKVFAATMHDVSVRDLGRVLAPELPTQWKPLIESATGNTTSSIVTDRGVEYLAICSKRQVSDDVAAAAVFRQEDLGKNAQGEATGNEKKYVDELRSKAQIIYR
ncbi:peptidylprolyl isomerase [Rhizobium tumorigenes]|uniref:Peptidylprolyl isomerase n=1 Tax=Rhizobium tumorigenes TaxID=2041385 RepID=A0AAF1K609_9HYPH|nr:peptidylprolyl isomerase [Rhizobium tumorigenes]WFR96365.1 peptidylprolyl isomerase [Rhizobium tumorigenes]